MARIIGCQCGHNLTGAERTGGQVWERVRGDARDGIPAGA